MNITALLAAKAARDHSAVLISRWMDYQLDSSSTGMNTTNSTETDNFNIIPLIIFTGIVLSVLLGIVVTLIGPREIFRSLQSCVTGTTSYHAPDIAMTDTRKGQYDAKTAENASDNSEENKQKKSLSK